MAKRGELLFVCGLSALLPVVASSCAVERLEPKAPTACPEVLEMPCVNGRVCAAEGGPGCEVCRCLAPAVAPLDHE